MQLCKYSSIEGYNYANINVCKNASMHVYKYAFMQVYM